MNVIIPKLLPSRSFWKCGWTIFLLFFFTVAVQAQPAGCRLRISLLTCAPGSDLYATFGHTALRVQDSAGGDFVFNYGTFEFAPDFYSKFIRGKLLYSLSVESFKDFMAEYRAESRSVQEQVLQLSCEGAQKLATALQINAQEDNRYYKYDFLYDNCTTRAGNMVAYNSGDSIVFGNILPKSHPTFRNMLYQYLDAGHQPWSKLGIDILLGADLDKKVSNSQAMFLPDYLLKGFAAATINQRPLASPPKTILAMPSLLTGHSPFTPFVIFSSLALLILGLSFVKKPWAVAAISVFDFLLFFILGLAGLLLVFMWTATDHKVCENNFNLLWALPTHAIAAFYVHSKKAWPQKYFRAVFYINGLLLAAWFFLPQQLNLALVPVVLLITFRSWILSKYNRSHATNSL